MAASFLWHDYETWGADPRRDRPVQFAALRTDVNLDPIGSPEVLLCRPADDYLPAPESVLITGITPQHALQAGLAESSFATRIEAMMAQPGTCVVGYNSIRFDDEISRHLLFRNLLDPYAREWQNGNSRWDLIDVLRMAQALRPEGMEWVYQDGVPLFKLELLSQANGVIHEQAHDALSDVHATLGLARRLRQAQPRLFDYALGLRDKTRVASMLSLGKPEPLLHVSARFPAERGCLAVVMPLIADPGNSNGIVCMDLAQDPGVLLEWDVEQMRERLYTPRHKLGEGIERLALKTVHINRSPMLAPLNTLTPRQQQRWGLDLQRSLRHARQLLDLLPQVRRKLEQVFTRDYQGQGNIDPEDSLYSGPFLSRTDRARLQALTAAAPASLTAAWPSFEDARLAELVLRWVAKNWPGCLDEQQREHWREHCLRRLDDDLGYYGYRAFRDDLRRLRAQHQDDGRALGLLEQVADWGEALQRRLRGGRG